MVIADYLAPIGAFFRLEVSDLKAPAFQLYAADFYMDTAGWTAAQTGAYFRLLMHEWVNGPLPSKMASLARIAGCDVRNMQKMWSAEIAKKFTTDAANMYVNNRLEKERENQAIRRELQSQKGESGAQKRWKNHVAQALPKQWPEDSSSSSTSPLKRKNTTFIIPNIEDVSGYCTERGKGINPQTWMDYYVSNGWMVGKNKMRDWKASIRTWETRGGNGNGTGCIGRSGEVIKKAGRASSDGKAYPVDHEF